MKRKIKYVALAVILLLGGLCFYMEMNFPDDKIVEADMTKEELLREMPEIAISKEELEMGNAVLALSEVQELVKQAGGEGISISQEETKRVLSQCIDESRLTGRLVIYEGDIFFGFDGTDGNGYAYRFSVDGSEPMKKTIIVKEEKNGRVVAKAGYFNENEEISKLTVERDWFAWLRELLKNGYRDNEFFEFRREMRERRKEDAAWKKEESFIRT